MDNISDDILSLFFNTAEPMNTDDKKPFMKPSTLTSKKKSQENQMTCERLLTGDDAV